MQFSTLLGAAIALVSAVAAQSFNNPINPGSKGSAYALSGEEPIKTEVGSLFGLARNANPDSMVWIDIIPRNGGYIFSYQPWGQWDDREYLNVAKHDQGSLLRIVKGDKQATVFLVSHLSNGGGHLVWDPASGLAWSRRSIDANRSAIELRPPNPQINRQQFKFYETITPRGLGGPSSPSQPPTTNTPRQPTGGSQQPQPGSPRPPPAGGSNRPQAGNNNLPSQPDRFTGDGVYRIGLATSGACKVVVPERNGGVGLVGSVSANQDNYRITFRRSDSTVSIESLRRREKAGDGIRGFEVVGRRGANLAFGDQGSRWKLEPRGQQGTYYLRDAATGQVWTAPNECGIVSLGNANSGSPQEFVLRKVS